MRLVPRISQSTRLETELTSLSSHPPVCEAALLVLQKWVNNFSRGSSRGPYTANFNPLDLEGVQRRRGFEDRNMKFFHTTTMIRRRKNRILALKVEGTGKPKKDINRGIL